ncbi:MAG: T9SS type A sorting domain-containing protein [Chitinophagales bacterium]|nr:T9SS type A sorting domain-containing protein [Chitinophagales bacterium]MDW8273940.1 T9SS type A sorting domain-containing protein [Chitinophagales bacterium]
MALLLYGSVTKAGGPNITYTPVSCTKVEPVTLTAIITDPDGIKTLPGFKPRLYYKKVSEANVLPPTNDNTSNGWKFVEATNSSSPFVFDFDFSKLTSAPNKDDSVQYFVIAEDNLGNTGWNSATFAASPASVNLVSAQFPVSNVANFFRTIKTYSGKLTVDPLGTANDTNFLSLTKSNGLFEALNNGALSGHVEVTIRNSSSGENGLHALNQWIEYDGCVLKNTPSYRLRIKPYTTGIVVSGKSANAIIKLNGADRVVIDGRVSPGNPTRALTLRNDSSANNTSVIHLISNGSSNGCQHDTVRFCNIVGGAPQNTTSHRTFGIYANKNLSTPSMAEGWGNHFNSFEKNFIRRVRYGIFIVGDSSQLNQKNSILFNTIGPDVFGIDAIGQIGIAASYQEGIIIRGNEIKHVGGDLTNIADTADRVGIYLGKLQNNLWDSESDINLGIVQLKNIHIDGNKIHHIVNQAGHSSAAIVYLNKEDAEPTENRIYNNMIYHILSNGNTTAGDHAVGIGIVGGNTDYVVYNSILMNGDHDPAGVSNMTNNPSAFRINTSLLTGIKSISLGLFNNVVQINEAESNLSVPIFATSTRDTSYLWSSIGCDFNLYNVGSNKVGGIGYGNSYNVFTTLSEWGLAYYPAQEQNSSEGDPKFKSATDLHILPNSDAIDKGYELEDIFHDFDGDYRAEKNPATLGADQLGKFYVWVGREDNSTQSDLNWRNYEAPPFNGGDSINVVVATEKYSWILSDDFMVAALTLRPGTVIHLDGYDLYALENVALMGSSRIYSGISTCEHNYNVEDPGRLILSGLIPQRLTVNDGWVCNLHVTNDSVTFINNTRIENDLIAKGDTVKIFHSNKRIEVKGDAKIWGELVYDTSCAHINCALFKVSGTTKQYIDIRYLQTTVGRVSSFELDKNATGDNSIASLGASLMIDNFMHLKKGKLISHGSNPQTGLRYKTIFVIRADSNAITRQNGNTNDAFFQGRILRKIGNAASYLFPVGIIDTAGVHQIPNEAYYTPAVLEVLDNSSNGNSIIVAYYDHDPDTANVGLIGNVYGDHSDAIEDGTGNWVDVKGNFVWQVEYSGDSLPYNIQLAAPFLNAENQDELASTPDELRVMKRAVWNSGNWGFEGNHAVAATHHAIPDFNQIKSARRTGLNTFSGFSVGGNSGGGQPLPVKLLSLSAIPVENKLIKLEWITATEINNAGFEVQRSTDGKNFEAIGWVKGMGDATTQNKYQFFDEKVQLGVRYYYRLLQKDFDGNEEMSSIVSAQLNERPSVKWMQLFPNPASDAAQIIINCASSASAQVKLMNVAGVEVSSSQVKVYPGINSIPIDVSSVPKGNYIVIFSTGDQSHTRVLSVN